MLIKFGEDIKMKKLITTLIAILTLTTVSVSAESLFTLGATQHYQGVPHSLFGGVQARQIGDLISIIMSEQISVNDNLSYSSQKESNTKDSCLSKNSEICSSIGKSF